MTLYKFRKDLTAEDIVLTVQTMEGWSYGDMLHYSILIDGGDLLIYTKGRFYMTQEIKERLEEVPE